MHASCGGRRVPLLSATCDLAGVWQFCGTMAKGGSWQLRECSREPSVHRNPAVAECSLCLHRSDLVGDRRSVVPVLRDCPARAFRGGDPLPPCAAGGPSPRLSWAASWTSSRKLVPLRGRPGRVRLAHADEVIESR